MRHLKKLLGLVMATLMVFAVAVAPAFAASGTNDNSGTITINNAEVDHTYKAYQVLVLESYNTEAKAYSYKANADWKDWLEDQTDYVSIDAQGYVTWVKNADVAAFAKAALAHAKDASIEPTATKKADNATVKFTGLNLGYYLVDTTVGSLCSLDTTIPNVEMSEKNEIPPVKKEVQEDSTGNWGDKNTAEIGDTVKFRTTITAKKGAQSYELHDVMSKGLTLNDNSIKVQVGGSDLAAENYTIKTTGMTDDCDFEIEFAQSYLDTITADTEIVVTYTAVVNEDVEVFDVPNTNKTQLKFGDDHRDETTWDETETYTFKVDVVKTDEDNKVLDGAQFKLYDAKTGGNEIALVQESAGVYRLAKNDETGVEYITTVNGQLEIKGFDADTNYYLEETKAPDGYNKLPGRVEIAVKDANLEASVSNGTWQTGGIHVVNKAGSLLPTTGGMGTTIFYVAGGIIVVAAAGTLVYRKRSANIK
ncbi:SpaH/EbpB family LPXTG-anchored major pilin [Collinsella tanakaei]|uniref:SpaH/EbpB family LPXTG-anchored major pilin n=1 Tax=Collinsella tanakaei TaxID=626935 RepID=UPI0025A3DC19|nr:SpaH/EbpB family LPXTG-anchored major pilin [Collinsella tanakaei]MDM8302400.1 SpaH/EbpB family LPXTG-anchored major pilin [Collinsella tanakaei]